MRKLLVLLGAIAAFAATGAAAATVTVSIRARLKIRVVLPQLQAGTCYVAGRSNVILS